MSGKLKATLLLAAMFILGAISGVAWQTYRYPHPGLHPDYASRKIQRIKKELLLTSTQEQAFDDIFQKAHQRAKQVNEEVSWDLADIHRDTVIALKQVLTPDQAKKFEQLHLRFHARHHTRYEELPKSNEPTALGGAAS